ncbi:MAG: thiamine pyrophosphate-dependent dehydrogenase E1 component subunit alpha, partial [Mycoplasma sp.]|nr:thiamine pyrophosphate-dependent dehydrogenase E1 component subunit alpha [Mycoplasma sp.]
MPKKQYISPKIKLRETYPNPQYIPCYTYRRSLSDELFDSNITKEQAIEIYYQMLLIRRFEEMLLENKATNKFHGIEYEYDGPLHTSIGQEAVCVGQAFNMDKNDFIFGTHRNHGETISKGLFAINKMQDDELVSMMKNHWNGKVLDLINKHKSFTSVQEQAKFFFMYSVLAEIYTKEYGLNKGLGGSMHMFFTPLGIYPNNAVVGASASIAIGAALYKLQSKDPGVVVADLGDGAIACGPVWEALNLMAMDQYKMLWDSPYNKRPPFILNIINNQYAMGGQPHGETHGHGGVARLGMAINPEQCHAERINGQDVLAVIDLMKRKTALAIQGDGPIVNEIMTYRYDGHSSADGNQPYRDEEEVNEWKKYDPIILWRAQLLINNVVNDQKLQEIDNQIDQLLLDIYKLVIDPNISPSLDYSKNDLLNEVMLNFDTKIETPINKAVELLQPLEENPRIKQLKTKNRYAFNEDG